MSSQFSRRIGIVLLASGLVLALPATGTADEVLDWNGVLQRAIAAAATPGPQQGRVAAIVHVSMFDALNGIERRFTPIHFEGEAPKGASARAAVAQAAYTALTGLFPTQSFAADLEASLAGIGPDAASENSVSIALGRAFGEDVGNAILAWRSGDNPAAPPYLGSLAVGKWRPTPRPGPGGTELAGLPGAFPLMGSIPPFVIPSGSSFRSATGPPALTSQQYADDVNEVKLVGEDVSTVRTQAQTNTARFWASTVVLFWNQAAVAASADRHLTLSENARLFTLLNVAMADSAISCWDSKYYFELWRPVTAIRLADTDGNPATIHQDNWKPLVTTPNYPEYDSGHQSNSGAAQAIMTAYFGDAPVQGVSPGLPGVTLSWPSFAAAADSALLARIYSGIHFRFAMVDTRNRAERIAAYVLENAAQPLHGERRGQVP